MSLADGAHAAGRRRIVTGTAGNHDVAGNAPAGREFRTQPASRLGAFDQARHLLLVHAGGGKQALRPTALAGVEPGGAGRVRHFRHVLAGQPQAQIVLGQQHPAHFGEDLGLVGPHPGKLRRGEARENDIAGNRAELRVRVECCRLAEAAGVVPENAGPKHPVVGVQQCRAVHLAGEANAAHRRKLRRVGRFQPGNRLLGRPHPVRRVLLRPAGMWPRNVERAGGRTDDALVAIDQHCLDARGTEIQSEIHACLH
ncbi:hypothetical protein D9M72_410210 [compost metagenome]